MVDVTIHHGDCLEVMAAMDAGSVDAVVTDPPYGLAFMGKHWDHGLPGVDFWQAALLLLPPSGYLLAFGGTRTWHRLACAIEDAGFEIRDTLMWLYGSGFPKGKSCLKPAWEPIILARKPGPMRALGIDECRVEYEVGGDSASNPMVRQARGCKTTAGAGIWGQGTAKPEIGNPSGRWPANRVRECTCAATRGGTVKSTGTGAVKKTPGNQGPAYGADQRPPGHVNLAYGGLDNTEPVRIHTDPNCPCAMLDGQTPNAGGSPGTRDKRGKVHGFCDGRESVRDDVYQHSGDSGGASRFFYCPKASRSERNAGCEGMEEQRGPVMSMRCVNCGHGQMDGRRDGPCCDNPEYEATPARGMVANHHPTVKPLALMRWLVKLVAQPGDVVLDPFMGSGTTGVACAEEGREFIGIEREAEYVEIARRRIEAASAQERLPV